MDARAVSSRASVVGGRGYGGRMDPDGLDGRVALVTGASSGIGARIAERLAHAGAHVALGFGAGREPAEALRDELRGQGRRAICVGGDLRDPAAPGAIVDAVERELGPVEVLVANAGLGARRTLEEIDLETWDETLAVNLRAPFLLAQRTVPGMRERGFGRVLFTSSVAAFTGGLVGPHYAASKAGLHGLLHFIAAREAPNGITVNAIAPALIEDTAMLPGDPGDLAAKIPVGRLGRPEEVADLALAVLRNGYLSNQVIGLDGAMYPR
jgi:3-oxoacyl-[acyl-carrier protein] reductase